MGHTGPCCHWGGKHGDYVWQCYVHECDFKRQCFNDFGGKKHWDSHKGEGPLDKKKLIKVLRSSGAFGRRNPQPAAESSFSSSDEGDDQYDDKPAFLPIVPIAPEQREGLRRSARVGTVAPVPSQAQPVQDYAVARPIAQLLCGELLNAPAITTTHHESYVIRVMQETMEFIHASNEHMVRGTGGEVDILESDTMAVARELNGLLTPGYRLEEDDYDGFMEFLGDVLYAAMESVRVRKHMAANPVPDGNADSQDA